MSAEFEQGGHIPPQDIEAERAVLGAILLSPTDALTVARELLQPESFYSTANGTAFQAMLELQNAGTAVDVITVREALRKRGKLENVGGSAYLNEVVNSVVSTVNIEAHCQIVAEKFMLRSIIESNTDNIQQCYNGGGDPFALADSQREQLDKLLSFRKQSKAVTDTEESLKVYLEHVERFNRGEVGLLGTGFAELDSRLGGGFQFGDSVVLAGNTGTGKSSFALQILLSISRIVPTGYFSLEMSKPRMVTRAIAQLGRVPIHKASNPNSFFDSKEDAKRYTNAVQDYRRRQGRLFLDCTPDLTVNELCLRIEKLVRDRGVKFVVVDHIGKLASDPKERFQNREREVAHFSWKLTQLAIKFEIVVLTVSPLNKEAENFTQPGLGHMRDSGMLSYDARTVLLLSNPMPDSTFGPVEERKAMLQIAKQGDGESGILVELPFHGDRGAYFGDGPALCQADQKQSKPENHNQAACTLEDFGAVEVEKDNLPF